MLLLAACLGWLAPLLVALGWLACVLLSLSEGAHRSERAGRRRHCRQQAIQTCSSTGWKSGVTFLDQQQLQGCYCLQAATQQAHYRWCQLASHNNILAVYITATAVRLHTHEFASKLLQVADRSQHTRTNLSAHLQLLNDTISFHHFCCCLFAAALMTCHQVSQVITATLPLLRCSFKVT